jgi:hypothetical protein
VPVTWQALDQLRLALAAAAVACQPVAAQRPVCHMAAPPASFVLPSRGFQPPRGEPEDYCPEPEEGGWLRARGGTRSGDLLVHAEGPGGSGRYWTITVGVASRRDSVPARGLCISTTTIGWRTLQRFDTLPLPWAGDGDGDGRPELVLWSSFGLVPEPTFEFALVAWVYELDGSGALVLDLTQSRSWARRLADAYGDPLDDAHPDIQSWRGMAAQNLAAFADGACELRARGRPGRP